MTSHSTRITRDGISTGRLHPEVADLAQAVMRRDMKAMRRHRVSSLVRLPYADLDEAGQLAGMGWTSPEPPAALIVLAITATENARIPVPDEATATAWLERHPSVCDLRRAGGQGFG
jgi:hypothetical protein